MSDKANSLSEFLDAILTTNNPKEIDCESLPSDLVEYADKLNILAKHLSEYYAFAKEMTEGRFDGMTPERSNVLCWPLKSMRSNYSYIVNQMNKAAKGNYSTTVQYLGEFSDAYNNMVEQLKLREFQLLQQSKKADADAIALDKSVSLFFELAKRMDNAILVTSTSGEVLYTNTAYQQWKSQYPRVMTALLEKIKNHSFEDNVPHEFSAINVLGISQTYSVETFSFVWQDIPAIANIITNVTGYKTATVQAEKRANTDPLTGLYNRGFCLETLEKYFNANEDFYLCFIDLDKLKVVNDTLGHKKGDEYLLTVTECLLSGFRADDKICRIGGDEFVVIAPHGTEEALERRLQNINSKLKEMATRKEYSMSISYGMESSKGKSKVQEIMDAADEKMYTQKSAKKESFKRIE